MCSPLCVKTWPIARRRSMSRAEPPMARQRASCYFRSPYVPDLVCRHGSCTHHEPVTRACSASHVPSLTACHLTEPCGLARRSTSRAEPAPPAPMASDGPISPIGRAMACHSSAAAALALCRGRRRIPAARPVIRVLCMSGACEAPVHTCPCDRKRQTACLLLVHGIGHAALLHVLLASLSAARVPSFRASAVWPGCARISYHFLCACPRTSVDMTTSVQKAVRLDRSRVEVLA